MLCEKKNRPLMFSVDRKIPTLGSTNPVGNKASFNGGSSGWDFPVPLDYLSVSKNLSTVELQLSSNSSPYIITLRL